MVEVLEQLWGLADELLIRDPRKLYQAAIKRGIAATQKQATEALSTNVARQVLAPAPKSVGKSAAPGPNEVTGGFDRLL